MRLKWSVALSSSLLILVVFASSAGGARIDKVRWTGDMPDLGSEIKNGSLLARGAEISAGLLEMEMARIDSISFMLGFVGCQLGIDTLSSENGTDILIEVMQGERTTQGEISVSGDFSMSRDELASRLAIEEGRYFDPAALGRAAEELVRYLGDKGHPFAQVWINGLDYVEATNSMDISVSIYEGDSAVISGIVFEGISRTDSLTAERISRFKRGSPFSEEGLERGRGYLLSSRIFDKVGAPRVVRHDAGKVDIHLPVEEKGKANSFSGVFGFSRKDDGDYKANGAIQLVLTNIGGKGRDFSFDWLNDGRKYSMSELKAKEPFFLSTPLRLDLQLGQSVNDTLYDMVSGSLFLSLPVGPAWSVGAGIAGDRTVFGDGSGLERSSRQRYRVGIKRDSGNDWRFELNVEGARKKNFLEDGTSETENQLIYDSTMEYFLAVTERQGLAFRLISRGVVARGDVSLAEMFPLGGARTLRGYRENQFRGEKVEYLSLEYRVGGQSRVFLFNDTGAFYREETGWTVKNGFGFGVRSMSRAGTIELSFAVGDKVSLGETKIHISLIETF